MQLTLALRSIGKTRGEKPRISSMSRICCVLSQSWAWVFLSQDPIEFGLCLEVWSLERYHCWWFFCFGKEIKVNPHKSSVSWKPAAHLSPVFRRPEWSLKDLVQNLPTGAALLGHGPQPGPVWCQRSPRWGVALVFVVVFQFLSCVWLCDPMNCSTQCFPVLHYLPELAQTHVHWVGDAIQPSHPLSPASPPTFNLLQHQGLSQRVSSLNQVAKVLELQLQHQSFQWIFIVNFL